MASREIKFRAWDKADKQMIYRDIFDRNWYATPKNDENGCNCIRGITPDDKPRVEIMQFAGLKDKHGKEIYEGDIVKDTHGNMGEVSFNKAMFYVKGMTWIRPGDLAKGIIIGNKFQNPELLEVKTK